MGGPKRSLFGRFRSIFKVTTEVKEEKPPESLSRRVGLRIAIIGGGIGGLYTAVNLIKTGVDPDAITIIAKEWPTYSRHRLASILAHGSDLRTAMLDAAEKVVRVGVNVMGGAEAVAVSIPGREILVRSGGSEEELEYDTLVIASGGKPFIPPIPGVSLRGVTTFHTLSDVEALRRLTRPSSVVVVGGGLIGLTAAVALRRLGHRVAVVEMRKALLPQVLDPEVAEPVRKYLTRVEGIKVITSSAARKLAGNGRVRKVVLTSFSLSADAVVMATGVRPNTDFLKESGLETVKGGVKVDPHGRTSAPGVYALGDCALSLDLVTGKLVYRPLGFVAAKYARFVAQAIAGKPLKDDIESVGVIPTIYERIGSLRVYRIGLNASEARSLGLNAVVRVEPPAHGGRLWSADVLVDDMPVGWEAVVLGHEHVVKSVAKYRAVRAYRRVVRGRALSKGYVPRV